MPISKKPLQKMKSLLRELEGAATSVEEMIENYEDGIFPKRSDSFSLELWVDDINQKHKELQMSLASESEVGLDTNPSRRARKTKASLKKTSGQMYTAIVTGYITIDESDANKRDIRRFLLNNTEYSWADYDSLTQNMTSDSEETWDEHDNEGDTEEVRDVSVLSFDILDDSDPGNVEVEVEIEVDFVLY